MHSYIEKIVDFRGNRNYGFRIIDEHLGIVTV